MKISGCYLYLYAGLIVHAWFNDSVNGAASLKYKPLVISSEKFLLHSGRSYHPESPARIAGCLSMIKLLDNDGLILSAKPKAEDNAEHHGLALDAIRNVHDSDYISDVERRCINKEVSLSPWDPDTYVSVNTFDQCILAQSAWLDALKEVISNKNTAFAITRPPGHHALKGRSMGFCIFNFAVGAAIAALGKYGVNRVGILDFDVHFGNGIASLVSSNPSIRYTSLHQEGIFPYGQGRREDTGDHANILNIPIPSGTTWSTYEPYLSQQAIPFLKEFEPELVIVSAGYDALASDEISQINLQPDDYGLLARLLRQHFGRAILFGLEGGYDIEDLPKAVKSTILAFVDP